MSLPRQHRLSDKQAFRDLFRNPRVTSDTCFRILAQPNGLSHSRLGMAVSRKTDRRAVQRNRIKRLVRESFRHSPSVIASDLAADYMVLPRPQAVTISNREMFERLDELWRNIGRKLSAGGNSPAEKSQDQEKIDG